MKEQMIKLCLLAYPWSRRATDGAYLRDLALEFAETSSLSRQLVSLLRGGVWERMERERSRPGRRTAVAIAGALGAAALMAVGALAMFVSEETEVEAQSCVATTVTDREVVNGLRGFEFECRRDA